MSKNTKLQLTVQTRGGHYPIIINDFLGSELAAGKDCSHENNTPVQNLAETTALYSRAFKQWQSLLAATEQLDEVLRQTDIPADSSSRLQYLASLEGGLTQCNLKRRALLDTLTQAISISHLDLKQLSQSELLPFRFAKASSLTTDISALLIDHSHQSKWALLGRLAAGTIEARGGKTHSWDSLFGEIMPQVNIIKNRLANYARPLKATLTRIAQRLIASHIQQALANQPPAHGHSLLLHGRQNTEVNEKIPTNTL